MLRTLSALTLALACLLPAAPAFADAKPVYDKLCASCHGPDGKGNPEKAKVLKLDPVVLDLSRPEANLKREELRDILVKGKNKMPAYEKKLKADEVDPVLDYAMQLAAAARGK